MITTTPLRYVMAVSPQELRTAGIHKRIVQ